MNNSNEKDLTRLALFPEQNPNPVIEANLETGEITYMNPVAEKQFPDLQMKKSNHDLFRVILSKIHLNVDFNCEVVIGESVYEQKIFFLPDSSLIRVFSSDITEQKNTEKRLLRLASFPELNPTPIIEFNRDKKITYFNPAFNNFFPGFNELLEKHPILFSFHQEFEKLMSGKISGYEKEIHFDQRSFTQRASWLKELEVVRIFTIDITEQKRQEEIIKEKNKDITDSINYAKKIQNAMLPPENEFLSYFLDSFILYQPKDIISGDFYWFTRAGDYRIFACADCTGHGVPGALMSMIGMNYLSHIVNDKDISSPDHALMELDKKVRAALKQDTDNESKDGMDIALCAFHPEKRILHYGGANRPMILIRNGDLKEISPSKFAIGGSYNPNKKFEYHTFHLEKNDTLYFFSDGITDQFGGPKGKKITKRKILDLLLENHRDPMALQKFKLQDFFENWKGNLEQVDDVCVMGIRI